MIGEYVECAREGCEHFYHKRTSNQLYHNSECTRIATNKNIMTKYYERRDQKMGKTRYCVRCETTKLSRYNEKNVCSACQNNSIALINNSVLDMLNGISVIQ